MLNVDNYQVSSQELQQIIEFQYNNLKQHFEVFYWKMEVFYLTIILNNKIFWIFLETDDEDRVNKSVLITELEKEMYDSDSDSLSLNNKNETGILNSDDLDTDLEEGKTNSFLTYKKKIFKAFS